MDSELLRAYMVRNEEEKVRATHDRMYSPAKGYGQLMLHDILGWFLATGRLGEARSRSAAIRRNAEASVNARQRLTAESKLAWLQVRRGGKNARLGEESIGLMYRYAVFLSFGSSFLCVWNGFSVRRV